MSERDWLQELKAGDDVIREGGSFGRHPGVILRVDSVTATQVVVGGERFQRKSGYRIGERGWHSVTIREPTPERREEIEQFGLHGQVCNRVESTKYRDLPSATWRQILDLLTPSPHDEP